MHGETLKYLKYCKQKISKKTQKTACDQEVIFYGQTPTSTNEGRQE